MIKKYLATLGFMGTLLLTQNALAAPANFTTILDGTYTFGLAQGGWSNYILQVTSSTLPAMYSTGTGHQVVISPYAATFSGGNAQGTYSGNVYNLTYTPTAGTTGEFDSSGNITYGTTTGIFANLIETGVTFIGHDTVTRFDAVAQTGSGTVHQTVTGFYDTAPVPEPDIYTMLVAGLGLMGWIAKRRNQA